MKMMFSLDELVDWLDLTVFEIWINLVSLTMFTMLLALKLDDNYFFGNAGWWIVFSPLFIADGLNTYFCAIIFMRMHMEGAFRGANFRALRSLTTLLLLFVFKYLLCKKLTGQSTLEYSEMMSPIFVLWQLLAVRACLRN
ncbi:transmembrane protein 203 [Lasioglossum baleicum]|uniref:transmembrane protein 203 n=1 Tax=Lasioglossum baleicum TaxID=434251 RepID=UPI003FCD4385